MSYDAKIVHYREYLKHLSYPEYAYRRATNAASSTTGRMLDLSLWNDGLPSGVAEAVARVLPRVVGTYSLAQDSTLVAGLAHKLGISRSHLIITAGADDALRIAAHYSIRSGTRVLIPVPCFGRYAYHALVNEGRVAYLPFSAYPYEFDVARIVDTARKMKAACIFIANPNSPTGHAITEDALHNLCAHVSCSVILDESLLLAMEDRNRAALLRNYPHVFICGSFSKLYGLPGLRIGYLAANPLHTTQLRQLVSPFGVDVLALEIAKYILTQDAWLQSRVADIAKGYALLRSIDNPVLRITHTQAPVALLEYTGGNANLYQMLHGAGVLTVAGQEFPGLAETNTVRVIIKNIQDMRRLKKILANIT